MKRDVGVPEFVRAVELEPNDAGRQYSLGNVLATLVFEEAVSCYRRGLALAPTNVSLHNALGLFSRRGAIRRASAPSIAESIPPMSKLEKTSPPRFRAGVPTTRTRRSVRVDRKPIRLVDDGVNENAGLP